jgi:hypothetical protein
MKRNSQERKEKRKAMLSHCDDTQAEVFPMIGITLFIRTKYVRTEYVRLISSYEPPSSKYVNYHAILCV